MLALCPALRCFVRISMNKLKDIHNRHNLGKLVREVVLSGFQWTNWRIYTTTVWERITEPTLFCQDFNEQIEGYTQLIADGLHAILVVLSGFQWTNWRIYTTSANESFKRSGLFCQDFNEQIEGYTQLVLLVWKSLVRCFIRISMNNFEGYTQPRPLLNDSQGRCFIRISMNNSAAKVQKKWEICKFTRNYFDISEKSTTFAATILKDIHNKDYSVV